MRAAIGFCSVAALSLASLAVAPAQAGEDGKQAIFDTVDRNAKQMTAISDCAVLFRRTRHAGVREHEAAEGHAGGGGLHGRTRRRRHADQSLGRVRLRPTVDRDRDRDRRAARRLADARRLHPQAAGAPARPATWKATTPMAASPRRRHSPSSRCWSNYNLAGHGRRSRSARRRSRLASRPFIVRAGYFKDVDAIIYLHIGERRDRLRPAELRRDQLGLHLPRQDRARRRRSVGRQGCARCGRADGYRLRQAARAPRPTYRAHRAITNRRHPAEHHRRHRADLVVRARRRRCPRPRRPTTSS